MLFWVKQLNSLCCQVSLVSPSAYTLTPKMVFTVALKCLALSKLCSTTWNPVFLIPMCLLPWNFWNNEAPVIKGECIKCLMFLWPYMAGKMDGNQTMITVLIQVIWSQCYAPTHPLHVMLLMTVLCQYKQLKHIL